tara:strand:- start:209 stop:508 length:300 start_codon:yes stop_codon:yes gene_type:complete
MFSRIRPIFKQPPLKKYVRHLSTEDELIYTNFLVGFTNVILITSLLWGVESYNKKNKTIQDCNHKINEIYLFCMKHKMDDPNNKDVLRRRVTDTFKAIR